MKNYYFNDEGKQVGPISLEELKEKKISKETLVWSEGMDEWKKAGDIEELKELFVIAPPPLPKNIPPQILNPPPPPIPVKENLPPPVPEEKRTVINNPPPISQKKKSTSNVTTFIIIGIVIAALAIGGYFITKQQEDKAALEEIQQKHYEETTGNYSNQSVQENQQSLQQQENIQQQQDYAAQQKAQEIQNVKDNLKRNLYAQVYDDYTHSSLGGVSNCYVLITNNTNYKMAKVIVKVSYISPSGYEVETSYHTCYNLDANSWRKEKVDDSNRGTSVRVSVYSESCPALGL